MVTARRKAFRALTPSAGQLHPFFLQIPENLSLFEKHPAFGSSKGFRNKDSVDLVRGLREEWER